MNDKIKLKLLTVVSNSNLNQEQKDFLISHFKNLNNTLLLKLLIVFEKEPQVIPVYVDYVKDLEKETQPTSSMELEKNLSLALEKLS